MQRCCSRGAALYLLTEDVGAPIGHLAPRVLTSANQSATLVVFVLALPVALGYIVHQTVSARRHSDHKHTQRS